MVKWQIALDLLQEARSTIAMYMFIIEEACQTIGMACYLNYKQKRYDRMKELASWALDNLINPAIDFTKSYGHIAYPLEWAYSAFFESAKRQMLEYIDFGGET